MSRVVKFLTQRLIDGKGLSESKTYVLTTISPLHLWIHPDLAKTHDLIKTPKQGSSYEWNQESKLVPDWGMDLTIGNKLN